MGTEYLAVVVTILFSIATSLPLGRYMFKVFTGQRTWLDPVLVPLERLVLRLTGVDPHEQQDWKRYSLSLLISNVVMWIATFAVVSLQRVLPLNPDGIGNMEPTLGLQHHLELHHQHEPSALQRRNRPVVSLADGRHQLPAVRDGRHRRGRVHRRRFADSPATA